MLRVYELPCGSLRCNEYEYPSSFGKIFVVTTIGWTVAVQTYCSADLRVQAGTLQQSLPLRSIMVRFVGPWRVDRARRLTLYARNTADGQRSAIDSACVGPGLRSDSPESCGNRRQRAATAGEQAGNVYTARSSHTFRRCTVRPPPPVNVNSGCDVLLAGEGAYGMFFKRWANQGRLKMHDWKTTDQI